MLEFGFGSDLEYFPRFVPPCDRNHGISSDGSRAVRKINAVAGVTRVAQSIIEGSNRRVEISTFRDRSLSLTTRKLRVLPLESSA